MQHFPLIQDLAVILVLASLVSVVFQRIRQPVVLGYLIAGLIVGPYTPPFSLVVDLPGIQIWAELGVIFLMFSLGLEFSFRKLTKVGMTASFTACFEAVFMLALGFLAGRTFGWSTIDSIFLGAILSISSTTIIIKALEELKLKSQSFAQVVFGILVVEDLIAILILVALSTMGLGGGFSGITLLGAAVKLVLVVAGWLLAGYIIIPRLVRYVGRMTNDETLTLMALGLCLALVAAAGHLHYSSALGAFIMGSIIAESNEVHRIENLIKPLRDVFAAVFFVSIGMLLNPADILKNWKIIAIVTVLTILGKVFSVTVGCLITRQPVKAAVQVGFGLAQIGEFSFIIAGLGLSLGVMSSFLYPVAVSVSIITTFTTPYLIRLSQPAALFVERKTRRRK